MKVNVLPLSGLFISILTILTLQPTLIFASAIDSYQTIPITSDGPESQPLTTSLPALDERKEDWAYDSWAMICANDRQYTFECQAAHYYCDSDGYLRKQYENGRGDGGCPFHCICQNLNPKPQCLLALTGMLSCLKRDLGQDEHDHLTLAAHEDTISAATGSESSAVATDDEGGIQLEDGGKVSGTSSSTIEPQVKPGSALYVGGTVVPARSDATRAAAGTWSSKVATMLNGVRKLAVRVKAQESVDHSTPDDNIEGFEPQVKPGAPPPSTPLTSGSTKVGTGKWSRKIADVFSTLHKPTLNVEKRKRPIVIVPISPATRNSVPFWAKQVSAILSSLKSLVG